MKVSFQDHVNNRKKVALMHERAKEAKVVAGVEARVIKGFWGFVM